MFERTLDSLIKGLRSHRGQDEPAFVATLLEEIRHEQRSGDMEVKAGAVLKLTYVSSLSGEDLKEAQLTEVAILNI
jgi:AP-3 complex subunit delta-1